MNTHAERAQAYTGFWSGALFGTLLGMASLLAYQFFSGILRRPRLLARAILSEEGGFETREALALYIATQNLDSGIQERPLAHGFNKQILHAGYRNFRESWARDFGFAVYGLLAIERYQAVRETLEAFLWHQKANGQLPVKLHSIHVVTRFFYSLFGREQPTELPLKPKYSSGHGAPSLDGQALLIVAAERYARASADHDFLHSHWGQLQLALEWLQTHLSGDGLNLLQQGPYADWADSVARRGSVLYTNVVYWKALSAMSRAAASLNLIAEEQRYRSEQEEVALAIQAKLWRPDLGYYTTSERLEQLSSAGNLLAVAWGLASAKQAGSILERIDQAGMAEPVPTRVAYPAYPAYLIAIENLIGGMAEYHTRAAWLWIGAWHVIALVRSGRRERAREVMDRIHEVIVRDGQVNEVHGQDGKPLGSRWYKSESPLTWNASMVVYACMTLEEHARDEADLLSLVANRKA